MRAVSLIKAEGEERGRQQRVQVWVASSLAQVLNIHVSKPRLHKLCTTVWTGDDPFETGIDPLRAVAAMYSALNAEMGLLLENCLHRNQRFQGKTQKTSSKLYDCIYKYQLRQNTDSFKAFLGQFLHPDPTIWLTVSTS
ncbi:hypothetical protein TNCT_697541 [Trichonephila clavata]|uniref:Uncharacterized protein n=1 Tax=Trichonephila clavata TaxID=2740835 RepID=A0A8X6LBV9_TRICU|nr:hypothetical protein TNCT_697541 [Trichonephila clavata]